jgi:hypothetical protein
MLPRWKTADAVIFIRQRLRDYLRTEEAVGRDLLREGGITQAQYAEVMAKNAPLIAWLREHEAHGLIPSLTVSSRG